VPVHVQSSGEVDSRLRVPDREADVILGSGRRMGDPSRLGIEKSYGLLLEPFTLVSSMTDFLFEIVNEIADATEVERLFERSRPPEPLPSGPPSDRRHFDPEAARRFAVLG